MSFKVAILGRQAANSTASFWEMLSYGIQVYELSADQICSLLQSPDHSNGMDATKLGADPVNKYQVYGGGRFFPSVTREEIVQVMQGVDVMLLITEDHPYALDFMTLQFYQSLLSENLLDQCKAVVLRIAHMKKNDPFLGKNSKPATVETILATSGLDKASHLKSKLHIVADREVKRGGRRSKKNKKEETDMAAIISRLRAQLMGEEVREAVTGPVKETLTAGKALVNLGQRLSSWVSSLIKS